MSKLESFKPGQKIACTITKLPVAAADNKTLTRLMRLDPANAKSLRRAQNLRRQRMVVYNRGNRDWISRESCAKVVHLAIGENWTMTYRLDLVNELKNLADYIAIKSA
jgi:hypothetical protein